MRRALPLLSALALVVTCWLVVQVAREARIRTQLADESATKTKSVAELRERLAAVRSRSSPPAVVVSPPVDPKVAEINRELADLATERNQARDRRNALNGYVAGFERLKLSPATLAAAKQIILDRVRTIEAARKNTRSTDEILAIAERAGQAEREQLELLLGRDAADSLEASVRESQIDWEIGTDMWDGGAPLTPEQVQGLALAQQRAGFERVNWSATPKPAQVPDPQTGLSAQDNAFLAASASLLSPAQQDILRRSLVENNQYNTAMRTFSDRQRALWQTAGGGKK